MKKIDIPNNFNDLELWNGNLIRVYDSLNIEQELNIDTPVISVQKATIETIDWVLESMWIKDYDSTTVKDALWRSWFTKIISKDYWTLWILATKWVDSTESFSEASDYYLWGNDIWNKLISRGLSLDELSTISWKTLWECKTELLFLLWLNSLDRVVKSWLDLNDFEIDLIATKFSPTLTKNAIEKLDKWMIKPRIDVVDSNSELAVQILEYNNRNSLVWWVEIVQSGKSLIATNNAIVQNGKIILPSMRDKDTWEFEWEVLSEINPNSQTWIIANSIQSNIDVSLYKILNDSNNKPKEFINEVIKQMKIINNKI